MTRDFSPSSAQSQSLVTSDRDESQGLRSEDLAIILASTRQQLGPRSAFTVVAKPATAGGPVGPSESPVLSRTVPNDVLSACVTVGRVALHLADYLNLLAGKISLSHGASDPRSHRTYRSSSSVVNGGRRPE